MQNINLVHKIKPDFLGKNVFFKSHEVVKIIEHSYL